MFNKTRRFLSVFIPVILTSAAALWSAVLSKIAPTNAYLPFLYVGLIAALAGLAAYFTQIKPSKDLEKPIRSFLQILADKPTKIGRSLGVGPRMNLMLLRRPWYFFEKKRIQIVWSIGMDNFPDVQFSCKHDQGVAGMALKSMKPVFHDCESSDRSEFRFNQKQLSQTKHVTSVWSWPIYEVDGKGNQTGQVIGVVNLNTTKPKGFKQLQSKTVLLEKSLKKFCEVVSTIV